MSILRVSIFLILGLCSTGQVSAAAHWNIGFQQFSLDTRIVGIDATPVALWYPTDTAVQLTQIGPVQLPVAINAEPIASFNALVVMSHGFSGSYLSMSDMAMVLASNGFLVATPTHPDRQGLAHADVSADPLVLRPQQLSRIIDQVMQNKALSSRLSTAHVGAIGFSLGAYAVTVLAGARPDGDQLGDYCELQHSDDLLCSDAAMRRVQQLNWQVMDVGDRKPDVLVLLAPAYGPLFAEPALQSVHSNVFMASAAEDDVLNNRYHADHFAQFLPGLVSHVRIPEAGHYVFLASCPSAIAQLQPRQCNDPAGVDREAIHRQLNQQILKYFKLYL